MVDPPRRRPAGSQLRRQCALRVVCRARRSRSDGGRRSPAKSASEAELRTLEEKHRVTARHFGDIDSFVQENKALRDQIYGAAHNRFLERSRRCTIRWLFSDRRRSTPRSGSNARCFNIREIARVQPGEGHGIHAPAYPQRLRKAPLGAEGRFCSGARPDARIQIDEARAELVGRPRRRR